MPRLGTGRVRPWQKFLLEVNLYNSFYIFLHNLEENWKKCAVKAKHFSNPGMFNVYASTVV
jgi:hypothetical protein